MEKRKQIKATGDFLTGKKTYLWVALIAIPLQFVLFRIWYPRPEFMGDSYSYISAALLHINIGEWPVGYSKFLGLVHFFTHADYATVFVQYLLIELSSLYFLFTLGYFMKPAKWVFNTLFIFLVFNPLYLFMSNYITSDALFVALSFLWVSQLIWIVYRPSITCILLQAILLLLVFTVRYNAIYYPFIAALAFLLSSLSWRRKVMAIGLSFLLIVGFVDYTKTEFEKVTGTSEFSAFSGWQLANNALYMYKHVNPTEDPVPENFTRLDSITRAFYYSIRADSDFNESYVGTYYLWAKTSPLTLYLNDQYPVSLAHQPDFFTKWAAVAPLYSDYASYLIRKYPTAYIQHFVWPNMFNYVLPPLEVLAVYKEDSGPMDARARLWFDYDNRQIAHSPDMLQATILSPYPALSGLVNVCFILCILFFVLFGEYKRVGRVYCGALLLITILWLSNFAFSVSASPIVLRYQIFPIILFACFSLLLIDVLVRAASEQPVTTKLQPQYS